MVNPELGCTSKYWMSFKMCYHICPRRKETMGSVWRSFTERGQTNYLLTIPREQWTMDFHSYPSIFNTPTPSNSPIDPGQSICIGIQQEFGTKVHLTGWNHPGIPHLQENHVRIMRLPCRVCTIWWGYWDIIQFLQKNSPNWYVWPLLYVYVYVYVSLCQSMSMSVCIRITLQVSHFPKICLMIAPATSEKLPLSSLSSIFHLQSYQTHGLHWLMVSPPSPEKYRSW
jgi:hypothetical protein